MGYRCTCLQCGRAFVASRHDGRIKYCSPECKERSRWKHTRADLKCDAERRYDKIAELYNSDYSTVEIAEMFNCTVAVVYKAWNQRGYSKRLTLFQKDVKALRDQGMCCVEIADRLGKSTRNIRHTCDAIGMPFTEDEIQKSIDIGKAKAIRTQYGDESERIQKQIDFIAEHYPEWDYVSGFVSSDGYMELQCKKCKSILKRSAVSIRHTDTSISCPVCEERRKQEEAARKKAEQQREKSKAFWGQDFQQINFKMYPCKECGAYYIGSRGGYCSEECRRKHINHRHDRRIQRAKYIDKSISLSKLYKRDKGICWICGGQCDYKDCSRDENGNFIVGAKYPSIDHVFPLSKGGDHVWDNVRLAHHYCNTLKSDKVVSDE